MKYLTPESARDTRFQHYDDARRDLARDPAVRPDVEANPHRLLLASRLERLRSEPTPGSDAVLTELIALAAVGLGTVPGRRNASTPGAPEVRTGTAALTPRIIASVIEAARERAQAKFDAARRAFLFNPTVETERAMKHLKNHDGPDAAPFDAHCDGHIVPRVAAHRLGIVRWARSLTRDRCGRIDEALAKLAEEQGLSPREAEEVALLRAEHRPLAFLSALNVYTLKWVEDLWISDPTIAVVYAGSRRCENPWAPFRIPMIRDPYGWLRAFFCVEATPALVEHRLGGFTVTAATGLVRFTKNAPAVPVPAWMRTLAELGLIGRIDAEKILEAGANLPPAKRLHWYRNFTDLLSAPIDCAVEGLEIAPALSALLKDHRTSLANERRAFVAVLARAATSAESALTASRMKKTPPKGSGRTEGRNAGKARVVPKDRKGPEGPKTIKHGSGAA